MRELTLRASDAGSWAACTKKAVHLQRNPEDRVKTALGTPVNLHIGRMVHEGIIDGVDYSPKDELIAYDRTTPSETELGRQVNHLVRLGRDYISSTYTDPVFHYPVLRTAKVGNAAVVNVTGTAFMLALTKDKRRAAVDFRVSTRLASDNKFLQMAIICWVLANCEDEYPVDEAHIVFLKRSKTDKSDDCLNALSMPAKELVDIGSGLIKRAAAADEGLATPSYVACASCPLNGNGCSMAAPKAPSK